MMKMITLSKMQQRHIKSKYNAAKSARVGARVMMMMRFESVMMPESNMKIHSCPHLLPSLLNQCF